MYDINWPTLCVWEAVWDRWLLVSDLEGTRRQALDLDQVRAAMALDGIGKRARRRIYRGLLAMEREALAALSEAEGR